MALFRYGTHPKHLEKSIIWRLKQQFESATFLIWNENNAPDIGSKTFELQ